MTIVACRFHSSSPIRKYDVHIRMFIISGIKLQYRNKLVDSKTSAQGNVVRADISGAVHDPVDLATC